MDTEIVANSRVAEVSKATFYLLIGGVALGGVCVALHSHIHDLACSLRFLAIGLGALALLRVLNSVSTLFSKRIRQTIHWVHAMVFELLALLLVVWLRLYSMIQRVEEPIGKDEGTPILLVHGYVNTASVWFYLRKELAKMGLGPIYTVSLRRPFASIERHAKTLAERVKEIQGETQEKKVILIGHSMGGLVCAEYATRVAPTGTVSKLITIASPLKGTWAAKLAPGANGREMERNSPFVQRLNRAIEENREITVYNIGTKTDQLVIPSSSSFLSIDPARQTEFDDVGHASLLFSPRVAAQLKNWLLD